MNLLIPDAYKRLVNPSSGYLTGVLRDKTANWLFHSNENYAFLRDFILHNTRSDIAGDPRVYGVINEALDSYKLLWPEYVGSTNPVMILHINNQDFATNQINSISDNYDAIFNADVNPDTGVREVTPDYEYGPESYSDGTWHPEHLFTNSRRNKAEGYWVPMEVNFDASPTATGLGHKYNREVYHVSHGKNFNKAYTTIREKNNQQEILLQNQFADLRESNDKYFLDKFGRYPENSTNIISGTNTTQNNKFGNPKIMVSPTPAYYGQARPWLKTMQYRPHDRSPDGLRDAGENDRRINPSQITYDTEYSELLPHYGVLNNARLPNAYSGTVNTGGIHPAHFRAMTGAKNYQTGEKKGVSPRIRVLK